ncbi:MAG TPA: hypothetical protein VGD81_15650 [Opitutaceae bacterium]
MAFLLIPVALLYTCGLALLAAAIWRAPEGYEDHEGFHRGPRVGT